MDFISRDWNMDNLYPRVEWSPGVGPGVGECGPLIGRLNAALSSHWLPVSHVVTITSWGSHTELGFLNTSPPHCIALLWIQEMSPSLSVIAVSYGPELSHFSQLSLKCSDDDKDSG